MLFSLLNKTWFLNFQDQVSFHWHLSFIFYFIHQHASFSIWILFLFWNFIFLGEFLLSILCNNHSQFYVIYILVLFTMIYSDYTLIRIFNYCFCFCLFSVSFYVFYFLYLLLISWKYLLFSSFYSFFVEFSSLFFFFF